MKGTSSNAKMVKESWSDDKKRQEIEKANQITTERIRQFNVLRKTPPFTVVRVVSVFQVNEGAPFDTVTMQNGDVYKGLRNNVEKEIVHLIRERVDRLLGLVISFLCKLLT